MLTQLTPVSLPLEKPQTSALRGILVATPPTRSSTWPLQQGRLHVKIVCLITSCLLPQNLKIVEQKNSG